MTDTAVAKPMFPPINSEEPNSRQRACSKALENLLRFDFNLYESEDDMQKREEVLGDLSSIVRHWILSLAQKRVRPRHPPF